MKIDIFFSMIGDIFWGAVFLLGGFVIGIYLIYHGCNEMNQYLHWDEYIHIEGKIISLSVRKIEHTSSAQTSITWQVFGKYIYQARDKDYNSWARLEIESDEEDAELAMKNHYVGEPIDVWIHPDKIDKPVLKYEIPVIGNSVWFILLGAIIDIFCIRIIFSLINNMFRKNVSVKET